MSKERKAAIARADKYSSLYVRARDADRNGKVKCCSCGDDYFWEKDRIQNGHFVPKGNEASAVRWLLQNQHGQCSLCNTNPNKRMKGLYSSKKGDISQIGYTQFMQRKYGEDIVEDLKARKFQIVQYSVEEIIEIGSLLKWAYEQEKSIKML